MSPTNRSIARATLMIVISACCFGSLTTVTLLAMRAGLSLVNVIFWRFSLAAVFLFLISARVHRIAFNRTAFRLVAIGGIAQALISYLSFKSLDYLPVGVLAFLFYTYPAWVAAISALLRKEQLTKARLVALILAMAGIAVLVGAPATGSLNTRGIVLALGTALLYALYLPALHDAQQGMPPMLSTLYLVLGIAATYLIVEVVTDQLSVPHTFEMWTYLLLLSVVGTVFAFGSMMAGLEILGPVRTSIISTVEPFFTALLGTIVLSEKLTLATLAGGAIIATAVIFLERSSERAEA